MIAIGKLREKYWILSLVFISLAISPNEGQTADAQNSPASIWDQIKEGVSNGVQQATGGDLVGKISNDVKNDLEGKKPKPIGYVNLGNGQYLTYFEGDPRGFPSSRNPLAIKPAPGSPASKVPAMVVVPTNIKNGRSFEGGLVGNNIEEMTKHGLLVSMSATGNKSNSVAPAR